MKVDKEKFIPVVVAVAAVAALFALQKLTTPHKRHSDSVRHGRIPIHSPASATAGRDHARAEDEGTAARSHASRRAPTPQSSLPPGSLAQQRSRPADAARARVRSQSQPAAPFGSAHGCPRSHSSRQRDDDRTHSRPSGGSHGNCSIDGTHSAPLTVESLSRHFRVTGTLGPVEERLSSPDPVAHAEFPVNAFGSTDPATAAQFNGGAASAAGGLSSEQIIRMRMQRQEQRSPSNAATVGSKSGEAPFAMPPGLPLPTLPPSVHGVPEADAHSVDAYGENTAQPRSSVVAPRTARTRRPPGPNAPAPETAVVTESAPALCSAEVQTEVQWFTESRATQTDRQRMKPHSRERAAVGRETLHVSELGLSPITPAKETERLASASPAADSQHQLQGQSTDGARSNSTRVTESSDRVGGDPKSPLLPRHLLLDTERQLNAIVASLSATHPYNAASWMVLYCYLKELSPRALHVLRQRGRVMEPPHMIDDGSSEHPDADDGRVSGQLTLEREVLGLLHGESDMVNNTAYYFKWKGSRILRRDGDYQTALARKLAKLRSSTPKVSERFAHLVVADEPESDLVCSELSGGAAAPCMSEADALITVVKRYAFVLTQGASTQTDGPVVEKEMLTTDATSSRASLIPSTQLVVNEVVNVSTEDSLDFKTPTNAHHYDGMEQHPQGTFLDGKSEQLTAVLQQLVAMKASGEFEALRYGAQNALFACDFIEVAADAQRLLDSLHVSPASVRIPKQTCTSQARGSTPGPEAQPRTLRKRLTSPGTDLGSRFTPEVNRPEGNSPNSVLKPTKPAVHGTHTRITASTTRSNSASAPASHVWH